LLNPITLFAVAIGYALHIAAYNGGGLLRISQASSIVVVHVGKIAFVNQSVFKGFKEPYLQVAVFLDFVLFTQKQFIDFFDFLMLHR
jgi:hypothetical protein